MPSPRCCQPLVCGGLTGYPFLDCRHPIGTLGAPDLDKIGDALAESIERLITPR